MLFTIYDFLLFEMLACDIVICKRTIVHFNSFQLKHFQVLKITAQAKWYNIVYIYILLSRTRTKIKF